jgi:hypothetical protein
MNWTRTLIATLALAACNDVKETTDEPNEQEVITTVELVFTPVGGGDGTTARWADPENDGSPVIDEIVLSDAADYTVTVGFLNELEDPAEEITVEVEEESDQHQVFLTGSGVESEATGPNAGAVVTIAYADEDANGNPVGLTNALTTRSVGSGDLVVTLRHLPPEGGADVKVAGLAEEVAAGGFGAIGGDDDAQVTFPITVE